MSKDETESRTPADLEDAVALLAELRVQIEGATAEIERLTAELVERNQALDELESITDAVLGATDTAVILVGQDRRVRAMTQGAADMLEVEGSQVGRPLSTVLPDDVFETVGKCLDAAGEGGSTAPAGAGSPAAGSVTVRPVVGGNVLVVLRRT